MQQPPAFADLDWFADNQRFIATVNDLFWSYRNLAEGELYSASVPITKVEGAWHAVYDPRLYKKGFAALVLDLRARKAISGSELEAVRRKGSEEYRQRQEAAHIERQAWFAEKVEAARRKGSECLRRWGEWPSQRLAR